jgi:hypothetical protein
MYMTAGEPLDKLLQRCLRRIGGASPRADLDWTGPEMPASHGYKIGLPCLGVGAKAFLLAIN